MTNKEKYDQVFMESFSLEATQLGKELAYNQTPLWDSIGHMTLVSGFETAFNITMETEDIINFSSYEKGMEIMGKYGITFS